LQFRGVKQKLVTVIVVGPKVVQHVAISMAVIVGQHVAPIAIAIGPKVGPIVVKMMELCVSLRAARVQHHRHRLPRVAVDESACGRQTLEL